MNVNDKLGNLSHHTTLAYVLDRDFCNTAVANFTNMV